MQRAFHIAKPSDLLPELQGRLPIRVELSALTRDDMRRILTEPEASLIKQYVALMQTEGVTLDITDSAIDALADVAVALALSPLSPGLSFPRALLGAVLVWLFFMVQSLLFGTFLGITSTQVLTLAAVAVAALVVLAVIGRPLLFASIDPFAARAHGVPTRALATVFLLLLGATAAEVSQITGALLVFALLVLPAATAQRMSPRPGYSLALSVGLALVTVWAALFIAYYSPYPIGFWLTTIAFGLYALTHAGAGLRHRLGMHAAQPIPAGA